MAGGLGSIAPKLCLFGTLTRLFVAASKKLNKQKITQTQNQISMSTCLNDLKYTEKLNILLFLTDDNITVHYCVITTMTRYY